MATLSLFLESLGSIDCIAKLDKLINELKCRRTIITEEINTRVVKKLMGNDVLICWLQRRDAELRMLNYNVNNKVKHNKGKKGKCGTAVSHQGLANDDPIKKIQRLSKQLSNTRDGKNKEALYDAYEYGMSDW